MQYTDYDNYQTAVEGTDFGPIRKLITNIGSLEGDFNNQIDVDANWDSIVKEALNNKLSNFKTELRKLSLETTNLNNIDLYCKDLKDKIIEYKRLYSEINKLNEELKKAENHNNNVNETIRKQQAASETSTKGTAAGGSTESLIPSSTINNLKNQIRTNTSNFNNIQQEIEALIKKIKSIEFNKSSEAYQPSSVSSSQAGTNGVMIGSIDAKVLVEASSGQYNTIFQNQIEQPIKTNLEALHLSVLGLRNSQGLAEIVSTNMPGSADINQQVAVALANQALPKISAQIAQAETALAQQNALLEKTKALNTNKFLFGRDGEIRELAVLRDREKDPNKIKEYNDKIEAAIAKFNAENSGLIPMGDAMVPVLTATVSSYDQVSSSAKETEVLSLFTESLYNSPPPETAMETITDSNGNFVGYKIEDSRIESSPQTYVLNVTNDGYQVTIENQGTYFYKGQNNLNDYSAVSDSSGKIVSFEIKSEAEQTEPSIETTPVVEKIIEGDSIV